MGTEKRARQKENRQLKLQELEKAEKQDKFRQYAIMGAIIFVVLIGGLALLSYATGDDSTETAATEDVDSSDDASTADDSTADDSTADDSATDDTAADTNTPASTTECPAADGSSPAVLEFAAAPPTCIDPTATYSALFDTNLGPITIDLDAAKAPNTVNNFVVLARYHYYDGTVFHRIIEDFMIQGGDPTGTPPGTGGPGYTIEEEVPQAGEYQVGSIAMAKRSAPGTTGAQFFIVTGPQGEALPPQYSLFGQVTEGLDVVKSIEALPTDGSDYPTEEIIINSVTITEA
ncbi:MAG: peptidylprolyl isomerase [Acidimicrobiales bacterium]